MRIENRFDQPFDDLDADAERWGAAFGPDRAADWERLGTGHFVVTEDDQRVAGLLVFHVPTRGWSLLWDREAAAGGGEWVSNGNPARLDRWVQDRDGATMPEGSFVNGSATARRVVRFLQAPLDPPEGGDWADSLALDWPERV